MGKAVHACRFCGQMNPETAASCAHCGRTLSIASSRLAAGDAGSNPSRSITMATEKQTIHSLFGEHGVFSGKEFLITDACLTVGRSRQTSQNQIVIEDPEVSRLHARLQLTVEGKARLEDCHSANGTFVNNRQIQEALLESGDTIRFGINAANAFIYRTRLAASSVQTGKEPLPEAAAIISQSPTTSRPPDTLHLQPEAEPAAHPRLQLVLDQYAVEDHVLEGVRMGLGRLAGPGRISINDPSISERHAELVLAKDGRAILRDLGSLHGTFVNGEPIKESSLQEGDLIQLGKCQTRLLLYREPHHRALVLRDITLNRPISTLGRDVSNSIQLNHPTVSLFHAEIRKLNGAFELIDKNSTNGTYINGIRIARQVLRARDRMALGAVQLVFDGNHIDQHPDSAGVNLRASGLCRSVRDHNTGLTVALLDKISLSVEPREFIGLLGPAGSGKSTLIHALNGSQPADSGRVTINNCDLYQEYAALRAVMGYLPQEDILHRTLTTRECLYYAARLRLPDDFTESEIWDRVEEVINTLDLAERADTQIRSLSGGQRKRVSLGIELLSKPSLLFMDEPTAGQDPRTEMRMMQHFREIANRGATVIITTHLLSSFSLLDRVGVLVKGKLAYYGPSQDMLSYFKTARPTDVFNRLEEKKPEEWAARFRKSECYRGLVADAPEEASPARIKRRPRTSNSSPECGYSCIRQLNTLLQRQFVLRLKDLSSIIGLLLPPFVVAFLVGMMKQQANEPRTLFMIIFSALWFGCSTAVREIVDEQATYRRERERNLSIPSYLGSKLVYVVLLGVAQSGLFVSVLTLMNAQQNHFLMVWCIMSFMALQGSLIGLLISALASTPEKALYIFPLALIPQLLLAGLFVPVLSPQPFLPVLTKSGQYEFQEIPRELLPRGMSPALRSVVSPLMVSRWGLETLADLYIHDWTPGSLVLLNSLTVTMHPNDSKEARASLELANRNVREGNFAPVQTPQLRPATGVYMGILGAFAVCMIGFVAVSLRFRDPKGHL
jgi:ABC transport system ATP-binding/permease protein